MSGNPDFNIEPPAIHYYYDYGYGGLIIIMIMIVIMIMIMIMIMKINWLLIHPFYSWATRSDSEFVQSLGSLERV